MPRSPRDPGAAEAMVAENLGLDDLTPESLGDEVEEDFSPGSGEGDDEGEPEIREPGEADEDELDEDDDLVSHREPGIEEPPERTDGLRDVRLREGERAPARGSREGEPKVKFDKKGNIVDAKTNKIIAPAGPAARFYKEAYQARGEVVKAKAQADHWRSNVNKAIEIGNQLDKALKKAREDLQQREELGRSLGLESHEQVDAIRMAADIKRNPIEGLKSLLTRAAANGIDLTKLGLQGAGFDAKSLMDLIGQTIDKRMQPLVERNKSDAEAANAEAERARIRGETEAAARRYFAENPEMVEHMPIFNAVLKDPRYQHMTLGEIGAKIQLNILRQRMQRGLNPRRRSLPNGRGNGMGPSSDQQDEVAHPSVSYDDIIKGALDQARYTR